LGFGGVRKGLASLGSAVFFFVFCGGSLLEQVANEGGWGGLDEFAVISSGLWLGDASCVGSAALLLLSLLLLLLLLLLPDTAAAAAAAAACASAPQCEAGSDGKLLSPVWFWFCTCCP
jgi:hypothetical protein